MENDFIPWPSNPSPSQFVVMDRVRQFDWSETLKCSLPQGQSLQFNSQLSITEETLYANPMVYEKDEPVVPHPIPGHVLSSLLCDGHQCSRATNILVKHEDAGQTKTSNGTIISAYRELDFTDIEYPLTCEVLIYIGRLPWTVMRNRNSMSAALPSFISCVNATITADHKLSLPPLRIEIVPACHYRDQLIADPLSSYGNVEHLQTLLANNFATRSIPNAENYIDEDEPRFIQTGKFPKSKLAPTIDMKRSIGILPMEHSLKGHIISHDAGPASNPWRGSGEKQSEESNLCAVIPAMGTLISDVDSKLAKLVGDCVDMFGPFLKWGCYNVKYSSTPHLCFIIEAEILRRCVGASKSPGIISYYSTNGLWLAMMQFGGLFTPEPLELKSYLDSWPRNAVQVHLQSLKNELQAGIINAEWLLKSHDPAIIDEDMRHELDNDKGSFKSEYSFAFAHSLLKIHGHPFVRGSDVFLEQTDWYCKKCKGPKFACKSCIAHGRQGKIICACNDQKEHRLYRVADSLKAGSNDYLLSCFRQTNEEE